MSGLFVLPLWLVSEFLTSAFLTCDYVVAHVKKVVDKNPGRQIGSAIENMLKTGRLVTQSGLDLQQVCITSGTTVRSCNTNEVTVLLSVPSL